MSTVRANNYRDASGGSNAQLFGVASPPNSMGFRNRIINGDMRIDQRNAGASVTPTVDGTYTIDRYETRISQASKISIQRSTVAPTGFTNSMLVTSLAATSVGTSDYFAICQSIEGFNTADFNYGTANAVTLTLSFWVRSSLTGTFGGAVSNGAGRNYPFAYSIASANTWEQNTVTFAGDTTGSWPTTNGKGMQIAFGLGVGSTFSGTAGAWGTSGVFSSTGATSVVGTNGATFYITGVQLEAGTVASPFERRDYGRELIMCQRYFEAMGFYPATTAGTPWIQKSFAVTKRATPSIAVTPTPTGWAVLAMDATGVRQDTNNAPAGQVTVAASSEL